MRAVAATSRESSLGAQRATPTRMPMDFERNCASTAPTSPRPPSNTVLLGLPEGARRAGRWIPALKLRPSATGTGLVQPAPRLIPEVFVYRTRLLVKVRVRAADIDLTATSSEHVAARRGKQRVRGTAPAMPRQSSSVRAETTRRTLAQKDAPAPLAPRSVPLYRRP